MIKMLKKRLTLLFICSVMGIFTVVFCLFIHESIQSKKENEMNFFTRMITYLVFQLENTDDAAGDLTLTGQTYDFTLLLKNLLNLLGSLIILYNHSKLIFLISIGALFTFPDKTSNEPPTPIMIPLSSF